MDRTSRRTFVKRAALGCAGLWTAGKIRLLANPLGLPIGLQLYTVRQRLQKDFEGTLKQVGAIGYKEVEMAGFLGRTPAQIRAALKKAGLNCPSAHYPAMELTSDLDKKIEFARQLGLQYMVCAFPWVANPGRFHAAPGQRMAVFQGIVHGMTMEDWKWNADLFNRVGAACHKAGIQFCYHNHDIEFQNHGGRIPYDQLLKWCDAKLVKMELDCGWMFRAGRDPALYMRNNPGRYPMLHIKDEEGGTIDTSLDSSTNTELGKGSMNFKSIFAAAPIGGVKHYFVEQEHFQADIPPMKAAEIDYQFLHAIHG